MRGVSDTIIAQEVMICDLRIDDVLWLSPANIGRLVAEEVESPFA